MGGGKTQRGEGRRAGRAGFFQAPRWMKASFDPGLGGELLPSAASSHLRVPGLVSGRRQLHP